VILLTKLNGEQFVLNSDHIQMIELIPESKIVLMNQEFFIVRESPREIMDKAIDYGSAIINRAKAEAASL